MDLALMLAGSSAVRVLHLYVVARNLSPASNQVQVIRHVLKASKRMKSQWPVHNFRNVDR
jgi:hypothetical protein